MVRGWSRTLRTLWLTGSTLGTVGFYARAMAQLTAMHPDGPESLTSARRRERCVSGAGRVWPRVSIIVPARNEEHNIRTCVESLLNADYPNFEVIVVDDASTDATPDILAEMRASAPCRARLRIVRVNELPPGWAGKPHALAAGAEHATGEWLLFTDADTRHSPCALRLAVCAALDGNIDLLSLETTQDLPDFWGRVLMPMAFLGISMQYDAQAVNNPRSPVAIANGQFILLRRAVYDRIGGYAAPALRGTLLDDRDLARLVKGSGARLKMVPGPDLVHTRMYTSFAEHWRGWGKNAHTGSRGGSLFFLAMVAGLPITGILPFGVFAAGLLSHRPRWLLAGGAQVAMLLAYRLLENRRMGVPQRYIWTHPLAAAVFMGILTRSWWATLRGQSVSWRGRSYSL